MRVIGIANRLYCTGFEMIGVYSRRGVKRLFEMIHVIEMRMRSIFIKKNEEKGRNVIKNES